MELRGKTVVITGASSGAGRAAALEFSKHGVNIVLAARNRNVLEDVADLCRDAGSEVMVVETDVSDGDQVRLLAEAAWEWKEHIDIWVNNAGVLAAGVFDETPIEIHQQVVMTNLLGFMYGAHAVLPYFKIQEYGVLINNISIGGFMPVPYGAAYSASKFGLRGFFEALKAELSDWKDIHVCDLFPAFLHTPGIMHAANYTGRIIKAAPPVYDPKKLARAMVRVSQRPRRSTYIGAVSPLLRLSHALFPLLTGNIASRVIRKYLQRADLAADTDGNVHHSVDAAMQVYGKKEEERANRQVNVAAGMVLGAGIVVAALTLFRKNNH